MLLTLLTAILVPIFLLLVLILVALCGNYPVHFKYEERPSLLFLYLRALLVSLRRKQGHLVNGDEELTLPREKRFQVIARDCRLDVINLHRYGKLCGMPNGVVEVIPPCYMETYFLPLMIIIVTSDNFKLSPLGLIHVGQSITQHTSLSHLYKEPFDLECSVMEYRRCPQGVQVDLGLKVYDRREMCVWEAVTTLLSRSAAVRRVTPRLSFTQDHAINKEDMRKVEKLIVEVPRHLGLEYAVLTGDWNPHHLSWTSRILGYKLPIAHGLWTLARALAHIYTHGLFSLNPPYSVTVEFKRPLYMPGTSLFTLASQPDKTVYKFTVEDKETGAPQLTGKITNS